MYIFGFFYMLKIEVIKGILLMLYVFVMNIFVKYIVNVYKKFCFFVYFDC